MRELYSSCDVLLKLSTVEGFFGPPLEMMACGGTAVVSKVTGHDEYIVDGVNALVVNLDDSSAAALALTRLRDDRALLTRLKAAGVETARSRQWSDSVLQFERFLETILAQRDATDTRALDERVLSALLLYRQYIECAHKLHVLGHELDSERRARASLEERVAQIENSSLRGVMTRALRKAKRISRNR
jgi:hypothetical protein